MIALAGGIGAAVCWSVAVLCSTRSTRLIGAAPVLGWIMLLGLVVVAPLVVIAGAPNGLTAEALAWLAIAGITNVVGLLAEYQGVRVSKVGLVAPIASTEGAIAAVIARLAGEVLAPGVAIALIAVVGGVTLAAFAPDAPDVRTPRPRRGVAYGAFAAVAFGVNLYAIAKVGQDLPIAWALLPARIMGTFLAALPLGLVGRLRMTRTAAPFVVVGAIAELAGIAAFAIGSRDSISVAAVLASQFGTVAAIGGWRFFGERLTRLQVAGVAAVVAGVAALAVMRG